MTNKLRGYTCRAVGGCTQSPVLTSPAVLCRMHALEIVNAVIPEVASKALYEERIRAVKRRADVTDQVPVVTLPDELPSKHAPLVYFARNGSLVKIGWSTNLRGRLSSLCLRKSSVVLTLAGDNSLESALHERFHDLREDRTEWFRCERPLSDYILDRQSYANRVVLEDSADVANWGDSPHRVPMDLPAARPVPDLAPNCPAGAEQVAPSSRMTTEEARAELLNRVRSLAASGQAEMTFQSLADIPELTGMSRGWVYKELERLADDGVLRRITPPNTRAVYAITCSIGSGS